MSERELREKPETRDDVYLIPQSELLKELGTNAESGLSEAEAKRRLETHGPNSIAAEAKTPAYEKLLAQFKDFTVLILIAAAIISAFTGDRIEAILILAIVIVNAILGVLQEGKAERAVEALQKMASPSARVIRGGREQRLPAEELVVGDLLHLEAGDVVPADLRILRSSNLKSEEAALTGESLPVEKDASAQLTEKTPLAEQTNMLFSATGISYGTCDAVVVRSGESTEIGRIATGLRNIDKSETPLQRNINHLGKTLGTACLVIVVITFLLGLLRHGKPMDLFLTSVSLAVAAIPEGLPAVVTIVLAIGMNRMARKNAIVKRLLAVETLGSVNVICSDKTGTLTQNEMTVREVYAGAAHYEVTGVGYSPEGEIRDLGNTDYHDNAAYRRLLEVAALCNDSSLLEDEGVYSILGDPTEAALLTFVEKSKHSIAELKQEHPKQADKPFDSKRKMMSVFVEGLEPGLVSLTKGAPDIVLDRCDFELLASGERRPLSDERRREILAENHAMAQKALRVLAFAYRPLAATDEAGAVCEDSMTYVGLVGMIDPPRSEARDAIAICHDAGIRVIMITGDHMDTAEAIARDLKLMGEGMRVVSGQELEELSDEELGAELDEIAVFARVSPEHKTRIVRLLKEHGAIVSMTGDGVNDAPALKQADIGVAMGITGTEVAKGAADMILTDDNFASIVSAVEEGRIIYSNIRKFVGFLLSCNIGEILVIFLIMTFLGPEMIPLLPVQLLWLNLVTDSFPALALGREAGETYLMHQKPRLRDEKILNREMIASISVQAIAIFLTVFAAFQIGRYFYPDQLLNAQQQVIQIADRFHFFALEGFSPSDGARSFAFVTLICAELLRAYSSRSEKSSVFQVGFFSNSTMNRAVLLSFVLLLLVLYVPAFDFIFHTIMLTDRDWLIIAVLFLLPFIAGEIFKLLYHRRERK
ncbi:MAG: cation-translocating P-type ATPase [Eubacteriales bacterium]|nr:cation-translocating P-type ATPase [Eubacteriales bacterium]